VFRPALRAQVEAPNGRPARVEARGVRGRVLQMAGPWRTSGNWWRADAWSRDEWDVALSDGALYRIYRDRHGEKWFIEGRYD
jgi:protein ImuB